jgi:hypothetical protein
MKTLDMSIQISADVAMRFTQIYDDLPPFADSVEGCDNRDKRGFFKLPLTLMGSTERLDCGGSRRMYSTL